MADLEKARQKRGKTDDSFERLYTDKTDAYLIQLLDSADARERTVAAHLLGIRKNTLAVTVLMERLKKEPCLYARISVGDALAEIGEPAIGLLIDNLGRIGSNQHHRLPQKGFYKKSYPLPRDLAARILIRIGAAALPALEEVIQSGHRESALEALDGLGFISFYHQKNRSEPFIIRKWEEAATDELMQWKLVRCMMALPSRQLSEILQRVILTYDQAPLRWEAVRSLALSQTSIPADVVRYAHQDSHPEVRKMAGFFLKG